MKNKKLLSTFLSFFALILIFSEVAFAQGFNSVTTPDGTNIVAVGNSGKLYRSANGGVTYSSSFVSGTPTLYSVTSFVNDVWIAGAAGNVYKTLKTSSPISIYNVGDATNLYSVFFSDASTGFVTSDAGKVFKTVNGGVNWTLSNSGISSVKLNSINFRDASNGTVVGNSGNIFVTADGGASWSSEVSGTTYNLTKVKYFGTDLVATGEFGTILKNTGSGWTNIVTRTRTDMRGLTGTSITDVHVCGGGGFIRNNKSGSSNFYNFEKNPMLANLTDIFYLDANNGWAVSSLNAVIIYTTNGGTTWSMPTGATVAYNWVSKSGASGNFLGNNLCQHPTERNTFFVMFSGQTYVSRNRGENWSSVGVVTPTGTTPHSFFVSPLDTNIWLVATESSPDKVYRSTNYGSSWTQILSQNFSNYGQPLEIDQNNPSVFYFTPDGGGFWKSTNSGASFTEISGNYPFRSPCEILVTWDSSNIIIVGDGTTGSGRGVIFRSVNGGVNWTPIDTVSSDGSETPSMCNTVFEKNVVYSTEWGGSDIYKSTDYGNDFTLFRNAGFSGWGSDIAREDPTVLITGSWGAAATISTNGGTNWTNINTGLSGHGGGILIAERGLVLAQQGSNLYKLNIVYTDNPVVASIDVQSLSLNGTGTQYYPTLTINPTGTVKNNNGVSNATFNVTRKITPGSYISTKTVTNLASNSSTTVNFDPWTFTAGSSYTVKDSVYINDDINASNDVLSGTIIPNLGEGIVRVSEQFTGSYPPASWNLDYTGTLYWLYSTASGYASGTGSSEFNYFDAPVGTIQSMVTPSFTASVAGDSLKFDYSYAPYNDGSVDSLAVEYSTNGGSTYLLLAKYKGRNNDTIGVGISMKTVNATNSEFTPSTSGQWLSKKLSLPVGTNKIRYRARSGFGNNLYLDNINITSINKFTVYNIRMAPEGLYNGTDLNLTDTAKVYLRNTVSPFAIVDSATAAIDSFTTSGPFIFKNAASGSYYIQILHRNTVETWSKTGGEPIVKGVNAFYDFTSAATQAYGNNMILISGKYCLYSGDVIKDGIVELSDILEIYNEASVFSSGYVVSDLTGDGLVDLSDMLIGYNNSSNFVSKVTPESSPEDTDAMKRKSALNIKDYFYSIKSADIIPPVKK